MSHSDILIKVTQAAEEKIQKKKAKASMYMVFSEARVDRQGEENGKGTERAKCRITEGLGGLCFQAASPDST